MVRATTDPGLAVLRGVRDARQRDRGAVARDPGRLEQPAGRPPARCPPT